MQCLRESFPSTDKIYQLGFPKGNVLKGSTNVAVSSDEDMRVDHSDVTVSARK